MRELSRMYLERLSVPTPAPQRSREGSATCRQPTPAMTYDPWAAQAGAWQRSLLPWGPGRCPGNDRGRLGSSRRWRPGPPASEPLRARRSASGRSMKCRRKRPPACSATARMAHRSASDQHPKSRTTEPPTPSTSCADHKRRPSRTSRLPAASGSRHVVPKRGIIHSSGVNRTALSSCAILRARVVLPTPGRPTVKCSMGVSVIRASLTPSPTKDTHIGMRQCSGMYWRGWGRSSATPGQATRAARTSCTRPSGRRRRLSRQSHRPRSRTEAGRRRSSPARRQASRMSRLSGGGGPRRDSTSCE
jgi:hypothetical protein